MIKGMMMRLSNLQAGGHNSNSGQQPYQMPKCFDSRSPDVGNIVGGCFVVYFKE